MQILTTAFLGSKKHMVLPLIVQWSKYDLHVVQNDSPGGSFYPSKQGELCADLKPNLWFSVVWLFFSLLVLSKHQSTMYISKPHENN